MSRIFPLAILFLCQTAHTQEASHPANTMMQMAADFARNHSTEMRLRAALDTCTDGRGSRLFETRRLQRQIEIDTAVNDKVAELEAANALGGSSPELLAQMISTGISAALVFFENGYFQAMQATFAVLPEDERETYCRQLDTRAVDLLAQ